MAIGRISGPLLTANLLRDGIDLAVETDLLYIDVNTHANDVKINPNDSSLWSGKIGIHNKNPLYTLDVTGTIRTTRFITDVQANIAELQFDTNNITATVGDLIISPATEFDRVRIGPAEIPQIYGDVNIDGDIFANNLDAGTIVVGDTLTVGNLELDGDEDLTLITTKLLDSNLYIRANNLGTLELGSNTNITGDLTVSGLTTVSNISVENLTENRIVLVGEDNKLVDSNNLTFDGETLFVDGDFEITGNINIGGNITIGNEDVDSVTVIADFTSDLIPDESDKYDLGKDNKRWRTVYAGNFIGEIYGGTY
jgi:phage baseplate assembly protein gpV